jgi:hypothetical protein
MQDDTAKHIKILKFIRDRADRRHQLTARDQRSAARANIDLTAPPKGARAPSLERGFIRTADVVEVSDESTRIIVDAIHRNTEVNPGPHSVAAPPLQACRREWFEPR